MQGSTQLILALCIAMSGIRLIYAVEEESFATGINTEMTQMTQLLCRDSEMVQQAEQAFEDFVEDIANSQGRGLASRIRRAIAF